MSTTPAKTKKKRRNGDGTTYRYKNGWRTVITLKGQTVTAMGRSEQESRRLAKSKLANLPLIDKTLQPNSAHLLFGDYMSNWLTKKHSKEIAGTTYRRYESLMRHHILPALGAMKIRDINKNHINNFMEMLADSGQSPRSCQQTRAVLSAAFKRAVEDDLLASNPVTHSREVKVATPQIHPLTLEEVRRLLAGNPHPYTQARMRVAVLCGLRQGEALGLKWNDVDLEKGEMFIWQQLQRVDGCFVFSKLKSTYSVRRLNIDAQTVAALRLHKSAQNALRLSLGSKWNDNNLVFPGCHGQPMCSQTDYRYWHGALANAGLPKKRLHDARHTAATLLYNQGVDIEPIRRFLGHASVLLTSKTYVHHSSRQMEGVAEAIESMAI